MSTTAGSGRRLAALRVAAAMVAFGLVRAAAATPFPDCLTTCDISKHPSDTTGCCGCEQCFLTACGSYKGDKQAAQDSFNTCVAEGQDCAPLNPGRCTLKLGCVRRCENIQNIALKKAKRSAFKTVSGCEAGTVTLPPSLRNLAVRACNRTCGLVMPIAPTTTVTTTTGTQSTTTATGSTSTSTTTTTTPPGNPAPGVGNNPCLKACLNRIHSLHSCYGDCSRKCRGNSTADGICQRACRNEACVVIKQRCTVADSNNLTDPGYVQCCDSDEDGCIGPDESPCNVTTSTTTSTTTTIATTTTTSSTTTTTSPQIP